LEEFTMQSLTRRTFAKLFAAAAATVVTPILAATKPGDAPSPQVAVPDDKLESEFLLDLALDIQPPHNLGSAGTGRLIVPVSGGTFEGPRLKGTIITPGGDWILQRADGSRVLDVRILLQTDDAEMIYMSWRGIAYTPPGGALYARILPLFETGSPKYAWVNNVAAVGVYRGISGKVAYRVFRIL
jgi:hypothetical protein